jgi:hypothetical protein
MTHTKTVLVVDDSRVSRMMARQYIASLHADWIVAEAGTGEESLVKAREIAPGTDPDRRQHARHGRHCRRRAAARRLPRHTDLAADRQCAERHAQPRRRMGIGFMEKPITEARIALDGHAGSGLAMFNLSELQNDALIEIFNIGVGQAAAR